MSGYLQRLALNVQKPGRAIHPILKPLFSPSESAAPEGNLLADHLKRAPQPGPEEPAIAPRSGVTPVPSPAPPLVGESAADGEADYLLPAQPASPAPVSARQEHPERGDFKSRPSPPPLTVRLPPSFSASQEPGQMPEPPPLPHARPEIKPAHPERAFVPLLPEIIQPGPASAVRPAGPDLPAGPPRERKRENGSGSQNAGSPFREPDEIQIHIGRIEVTAVPPAPLRPAAGNPRRKAPSLDDYLRHRGGRGG